MIKHLIKEWARVYCQARRWQVLVASAFPLAHHFWADLGKITQCRLAGLRQWPNGLLTETMPVPPSFSSSR
jgi:hypothetical protein